MSERRFGNDLVNTRLPAELIRHIHEFDGTFRSAYTKCMDNIALDGIHNRLRVIDDERNSQGPNGPTGNAYATALQSHFPDSDNVIKILNKCHCCPAHQFRKPRSIHNLNGTRSYYEMEDDWAIRPCKNGCECNCRNICRWLCRANGTLELN